MEIIVAEEAGFCFGVKRALKIIRRLQEQGKAIQTFGPLIHNDTVLENLAASGIQYIDDLNEYEHGKTLIIRTHGIPRDVESYLQEQGIEYVDATCPLVKKAHRHIAGLGRRNTFAVIVGDRRHPEIIAARSYATEAAIVNSLEEARALPLHKHISVVAQTTLNTEFFKEIVAILLDKTEKLEIFNTICAATRVRQDAVRKLAPRVDGVVVIGGKNSSNTKKLAAISREKNPRTFHIERSTELGAPEIRCAVAALGSVGITAGASTPPEEVAAVKRYFMNLIIEKEMQHGQPKSG